MSTYNDLEKMSVPLLRSRIKKHNIRGFSKMNKRQLIDAIAAKEGITKPVLAKKVGIKPTGLRRVQPKGAIKTTKVVTPKAKAPAIGIKPTGLRRAIPKGTIKLTEKLPAYEAPPPGYYPRGAPPTYESPPLYLHRSELPVYSLEPGADRISATIPLTSEKMDNVAVSEAAIEVQDMNLFTEPSLLIQTRETWGKERFDNTARLRIASTIKYRENIMAIRQNAINKGWFTVDEWTKLIEKINMIIATYEHQLTLPDIHRPPRTLVGVKLPKAVMIRQEKMRKAYLLARSKEDDDDPESIITASRTFNEWMAYDKYVLDIYGK